MRSGTSGTASIEVRASAETVYDTVSDVTRIPEWSPECVEAHWAEGSARAEVGARFVGTNRRGLLRWRTVPRVVAAARPERFAFVMSLAPFGELTRWTYEIEPTAEAGTTRVTERFEMLRDHPAPLRLIQRTLMRVPDRAEDLRRNLETSLERLRHLVEGGDRATGR